MIEIDHSLDESASLCRRLAAALDPSGDPPGPESERRIRRSACFKRSVQPCARSPVEAVCRCTRRRRRSRSRTVWAARFTRSAAFTNAVSTWAAERPLRDDLTLVATAFMIGTSTTAIRVIVTTTSTMLNPRVARRAGRSSYNSRLATPRPPPFLLGPPSLSAQQIPRVRGTSIRVRQVCRSRALYAAPYGSRAASRLTRSRLSRYSRPVPKRPAVPPTVPPFHAMAMNLAAERRAAAGTRGDPPRGRPTGDRRARAGGRRRPGRARSTTRLHERARDCEPLRRRLAERYRDLHDVDDRPGARADRVGRVGRLHARLPRRVRAATRGSRSSSPATRATATA